jgi:hypothetical protein
MGPLERRLAKHAHDVNVGLPLVRLLEERVDDIPPADLPIPDTLPGEVIEEGEDLTQVLLSGPSRNLPSPGELRLWQRKARVCIQVVKELWPEEVAAYIQTLDSKKDERLIRGM